jgi:hypothetical protein
VTDAWRRFQTDDEPVARSEQDPVVPEVPTG